VPGFEGLRFKGCLRPAFYVLSSAVGEARLLGGEASAHGCVDPCRKEKLSRSFSKPSRKLDVQGSFLIGNHRRSSVREYGVQSALPVPQRVGMHLNLPLHRLRGGKQICLHM